MTHKGLHCEVPANDSSHSGDILYHTLFHSSAGFF